LVHHANKKGDEITWSRKKPLGLLPGDVKRVLTPHVNGLPDYPSPNPLISHVQGTENHVESQIFHSPIAMLDYVTLNWKDNFVTTDLCTRALVEIFIKRPFFMLISVDAPLLVRYSRLQKRCARFLTTCRRLISSQWEGYIAGMLFAEE